MKKLKVSKQSTLVLLLNPATSFVNNGFSYITSYVGQNSHKILYNTNHGVIEILADIESLISLLETDSPKSLETLITSHKHDEKFEIGKISGDCKLFCPINGLELYSDIKRKCVKTLTFQNILLQFFFISL